MSAAAPFPNTPAQPTFQPGLAPTSAAHYNGDSSYWVQKSGTPNSALSTFIPFQPPTRPLASSASRPASSSAPTTRSGSAASAPAAVFVPTPPFAVAASTVRRPLFVAPPPPLAPAARAAPTFATSLSAPTAASAPLFAPQPSLPHTSVTPVALPAATVADPATSSPSSSPFIPPRVPGLSAARTAHVSTTAHTSFPTSTLQQQAVQPVFRPATTLSSEPPQPTPSAHVPFRDGSHSPSPAFAASQYAHSPNSPGLLSAPTTPLPSAPASPALPAFGPASSIHARVTQPPAHLWTQPVLTTAASNAVTDSSHSNGAFTHSLPAETAAGAVTEVPTSNVNASRPSRDSRAVSAVPSARRAHLIAKAKQLSEQRTLRQQQETQRLAQLQASLSTTTQPASAARSNQSLAHELDPLIAVDDALHTRYLRHTQQLQRKLAEQQGNMQQLSEVILRLQQIIAPSDDNHAALAFSPAFYQQENELLHSHVTLLQQRLHEREEEVALLSTMVVKKSARVSEVREEASVVVDEMRAAVKRLGADKERREREMREEREQLMSGLREMIDRCVRENEWMRLRLGEEGRAEMEQWKETEESRMEEREHDRHQILQKERQREMEKEAQRERDEQLQHQRLEEERQREETDRRRQHEADMHRQKEDDLRRQQEERKQPEPEAAPTRPVSAHFIARPSTVLTSSLSTVPTPASGGRRVHFRHPSASPTVYYEPAPASAPSSPLLPQSTTTVLHSHNHVLAPLTASYNSQPNSSPNHYVALKAPSYPLPITPTPLEVEQQQDHLTDTAYYRPSTLPSSSPRSYPSTDDSVDFDSYFTGSAAQEHFSLQSMQPSAPLHVEQPQPYPLTADTSQQQPLSTPLPAEQLLASFDSGHHGQLAHNKALLQPTNVVTTAADSTAAEQHSGHWVDGQPPHAFVHSTVTSSSGAIPISLASSAGQSQSSQPASVSGSSSLSDRVMGRIGGWMLGTAGRERAVVVSGGRQSQ